MDDFSLVDAIKTIGGEDLSKGNFVTLLRREEGDQVIYEEILTFSNILIKRRFPKNAYDATTKREGTKNCEGSPETGPRKTQKKREQHDDK